jgi:small-conductance mechanosensitive channel
MAASFAPRCFFLKGAIEPQRHGEHRGEDQEIEGKVVSFNLFETKLKTKSGDLIHIPNSFITQRIFVRYKSKQE